MRRMEETVAMLGNVSNLVASRLERLQTEGADARRIARERRRKKLVEETLLAIREVPYSAA